MIVATGKFGKFKWQMETSTGGFPMPSAAEFQAMTPDEFDMFWKTFVALEIDKTAPFAGRWFTYGNEIHDCCALKRAGWTPEPNDPMTQLMAWYWRRPPIGKRPKGKLFLSTNQAIIELRKTEMANPATKISEYIVEYKVASSTVRGTLRAKGPLHAAFLAQALHGKIVE